MLAAVANTHLPFFCKMVSQEYPAALWFSVLIS
jgi:hypothetical protein